MKSMIKKVGGGEIPICFSVIRENYTKDFRNRVSLWSAFAVFCVYVVYFTVLYLSGHGETLNTFVTPIAIFTPPLILVGFFKLKGILHYSVIGEIEFKGEFIVIKNQSGTSEIDYNDIETITSENGLANFIIGGGSHGENYKSIVVTFNLKNGESIRLNTLITMNSRKEHEKMFRSPFPRLETVLKNVYPSYKILNRHDLKYTTN